MRDFVNPYDVRRFLDLWTVAVFESNGGGGGGGGGGGSSSSTTTSTPAPKAQAAPKQDTTPTFNTLAEASAAGYHGEAVNIAGKGLQKVEFADKSYNDKMANVSANANSGKTSVVSSASTSQPKSSSSSGTVTKPTVTAGTSASSSGAKTMGQVSDTGQYAGDGFEWVKEEGTNALTRTYTGVGKDNNLGTDVIAGGTADKDTKEAIASVSLNEGSTFASSPGSATDGSLLDLFRDEEDKVGSGSFAEQTGVVDYTPTLTTSAPSTPAPEPVVEKTFGETFRENLEAGNKTFEYKGDVFTTELAPEPTVPSVTTAAAAPSYATMGIGEAGRGQPELRVSDQEDTTQRRATEEDLFEQPVVTETSQEFLDSLPDYEFDPLDFGPDADDPRGDQIVSPTGTGIGQQTFTYVPQANTYTESLQEIADQSRAGTIGADEASALLGLGAGQPLTDTEVAAIMPPVIPATSALDTGADFVPSGVVPEQKTGLVGEEFDPRTIMPTSEQVAIAEGTAQEPVDLTPQTFAEQALQALKSTFLDETAAGLQGGASFLDLGSSRLGAYEVINPNTGRVETVRLGGEQPTSFDTARTAVVPAVAALQEQAQTEYEKIDPAVRAEMEASQFTGSAKDLFNLEFPTAGESTGRGIALNTIGELADIGSDVVTGLTLGLPAVFTKSFAEGAGSATQEIDAKLDQMVQSGTLQQDPRFTDAVRVARDALMEAGVDPGLADAQAQNEAIEAIRQGAYGEAVLPAGGVAAVGDTFLAGLAKPGTKLLPTNRLVGVPAAILGGGTSEGVTEGTEQALTNRAMIEGLGAQDVTLGQNVGGAATQAFLAGGAGAGGVRTVTPTQTTDSTVYVPPAATTGQVAQTPVGLQTAYEEAAGIGGPGSDAFPDKMTAAESIMIQQLEDTGAIDVADLQDMGLTLFEVNEAAERAISSKMDSDNQMLQALADQSVLDTGGISEELVEEINDKLGPEAGAQVVDNAINRPFVSNEGKTRMDIMLENAAKAGEESVSTKPATGIETALPGPEIQEDTGFDTEQQLDLLLDENQEQQLELLPETEVETEPKVEVETEPETSVDVEPETEVEVEVEPETTTDVKTTVDIPPVIEEPEEEPEVEEPVTETEPDVEPPTDIFVPPVTTTDDDGNEVTECPEGYRMVTTGEGPMCMKSFSMERQRAGAGTRAYTGLAGNIGRRGPGQRRKVTTQTQRVRPTVRRT